MISSFISTHLTNSNFFLLIQNIKIHRTLRKNFKKTGLSHCKNNACSIFEWYDVKWSKYICRRGCMLASRRWSSKMSFLNRRIRPYNFEKSYFHRLLHTTHDDSIIKFPVDFSVVKSKLDSRLPKAAMMHWHGEMTASP